MAERKKLCKDAECLVKEPQALSMFPMNRRMRDKRHRYCKDCSVRKVHAYRGRRRAMTAARQQSKPAKASPLWVPGVRQDMQGRDERVWAAIQAGARTQKEIKARAKIETNDELGLSLSELMLIRGCVKSKLIPLPGAMMDDRIYFPAPEVEEAAA